ncbi:MAG TPA: hypothetical protein VIV14_06675 [Gammaproteobacteria bacterium]
MKKIEFGQSVSILANLGVIAGIVFLALELRQNNDLMEAATRAAQNERIQDYAMQLYTVPGLAEILVKHKNGEPLTEAEELQLFGRKVRMLRGFEAQYRESVLGTAEDVPVGNWIRYFYRGSEGYPPLFYAWDEAKPLLTPDFVQFFEENVVSQC